MKDAIEALLAQSNDKELQLVALAQVVDKFLSDKKESEKGVNINESAAQRDKKDKKA